MIFFLSNLGIGLLTAKTCSKKEFTVGLEEVTTTTTTTPRAVTCHEHKWPDLDKGITCGTCKVLVTNMNKKYQTCSKYFASFGRYCEGAWEGKHDSCVGKKTETCYHRFGSYTSDAICQCGDAYRIWTTKRPQSTVCTDLGNQWTKALRFR